MGSTNNFTDSDHLFAYHLHQVSRKKGVQLKDAEYKLIALSRAVKRTRSSWSRKVENFDAIRDGGTQHGNAHKLYNRFKSEYNSNPEKALLKAVEELRPFSAEARKLFLELDVPERILPSTISEMRPLYFGVIKQSDIVKAVELIKKGRAPHGFNDSSTYDVIVDGEKHPPKQVVAIAYRIAGGPDLRGSDFSGGKGTECFKCLEELGFTISEKRGSELSSLQRHPMNNSVEQFVKNAACSKPFVILAGGTGTGKTRAAKLVAASIAGRDNVEVVAVGADWTDNRPLLGFRNLLAAGGKTYVAPPALRIILKALGNTAKPHFLILDEMNLSHVERYFADFLSSMESKEPLKLHDSADDLKTEDGIAVKGKVDWPSNLFVIGTVNIDETTYMFSPKVLDRAHVIEFKVAWDEIEGGLDGAVPGELPSLQPAQIDEFMRVAGLKDKTLSDEDHDALVKVLEEMHEALDGTRFVFAHRTARECLNFIATAKALAAASIVPAQDTKDLIDLAILQKALPKLNGAAGTLSKVLDDLIKVADSHDLDQCKTKLESMSRQLKADQFVSFIQ